MINKRVLLSPLLLFSILLPVTGEQPQNRPSPEPQPTPSAQQQNPPPTSEQDVVRITTNLVQIDAVVTRDGKLVTDLKAEDFEIFENGRPQTITNFSYVSNVPDTVIATAKAGPKDKTAPPVPPAVIRPQDVRRTIALVVDELGMSFESINAVRKQLRAFVADLPPNDLVAIIRTGGEMGALQQFTNDRRVLENAINQVRWNHCSRVGVDVFPRIGSMFASSNHLCSLGSGKGTLASINFILRGMSHLPGRKSMVFLSDSLPVQDQELSN